MLYIHDQQIIGSGAWNGGENKYLLMRPWAHESGAARWILAADGFDFQDDDGQVYRIRQRTQAELEATPEYQAWAGTQPLPAIYATLAFSGGDGKAPVIGVKPGHPQRGVLQIAGDLRATPDAPGLPVSITFEWRITLRKVISEFALTPIDSFSVDGCTVVNNVISMAFDPAGLGVSPGIYVISDEDFATVPGAAFGLPSDYQVKLVGGNKLFKVLR